MAKVYKPGVIDFNDIAVDEKRIMKRVEEPASRATGRKALAIDKQAEEIMGLASERGIGLAEAEEVNQKETYRQIALDAIRSGSIKALQAIISLPEDTMKQAELFSRKAGKAGYGQFGGGVPGLDKKILSDTSVFNPNSPMSKILSYSTDWAQQGLTSILESHPEWQKDPPESFIDLLTDPRKLATAVVEAVPMLVSAGILTLTGHPVAAYIVVDAIEGDSAKEEAKAFGATEEEQLMARFIYGKVSAVMEMGQLSLGISLAKGSYRAIRNRMAKQAMSQVSKSGSMSITKRWLLTILGENVQEWGQGTWQEKTAKMVYGKEPEGGLTGFIDRRLQESLVITALTIPTGGIGAAAGVAGGKAAAKAKPTVEEKVVPAKKEVPLTEMPWKDLQTKARELGVPAFQARETLIPELERKIELAAMPISQRLKEMQWPELQREARKRGIYSFQQRDKLEEEILLQEGLKDIPLEEQYGAMNWSELQGKAREMGIDAFQKRSKVIADMLGKEQLVSDVNVKKILAEIDEAYRVGDITKLEEIQDTLEKRGDASIPPISDVIDKLQHLEWARLDAHVKVEEGKKWQPIRTGENQYTMNIGPGKTTTGTADVIFAARELDLTEKIGQGIVTVEEAAKVLDEFSRQLKELPIGEAREIEEGEAGQPVVTEPKPPTKPTPAEIETETEQAIDQMLIERGGYTTETLEGKSLDEKRELAKEVFGRLPKKPAEEMKLLPIPAEEKPPTVPPLKTPSELLLDAGYWQGRVGELRSELEALKQLKTDTSVEEAGIMEELVDALKEYHDAEEALDSATELGDLLSKDKTVEGLLKDVEDAEGRGFDEDVPLEKVRDALGGLAGNYPTETQYDEWDRIAEEKYPLDTPLGAWLFNVKEFFGEWGDYDIVFEGVTKDPIATPQLAYTELQLMVDTLGNRLLLSDPESREIAAKYSAEADRLLAEGRDLGLVSKGRPPTYKGPRGRPGFLRIPGFLRKKPKPPKPTEPPPPAGKGPYRAPSQEELNKTNDELLAKLSEVQRVRKDEEIPAIKRMHTQQIARSLGIQEAAAAEGVPAADVIRRSKGGYKVSTDIPQYTPIKLTKKQWDAYSRQVYNVYTGPQYKFQQTAAQDALDKLKDGRLITDAEAALLIPVMGLEVAEQIATTMEKLGDKYQRFWNLARDLVLFWKMPFNFDVQFTRNAVNFVGRHPIKYTKGTYEALRSFASKDYTNTLIQATRGDPAYAEAEAYGIPFLQMGQLAPLGKVPEQFRGRLPYRLAKMGKKRGKIFRRATTGIRIIGKWQLAAERSFVASANWFMLDLWKSRQKQWDASLALLEETGLSFDERERIKAQVDKHKKNYADVVGNYMKIIQAKSSTGRAIQTAANYVLWSPSMTWSRFRRPEMMLLKSGSRAYAMSIEATSVAKIFAVGAMLTMVANYYRDDDDQIEVELDPRSSNWGRFKVGDTWLDFGGGEIQHYRTVAQFIVGSIKTQSGRTVEIPRAELAQNYIEGRETALIGIFHEILTGESLFGQKVWAAPDLEQLEKEGTVTADIYAAAWRKSANIPGGQDAFLTGRWLTQHLMPAALVSFAEASITDGWPQAVAAGLTEAMAMGAQSYKQRASAELAILQDELAQAYYKTPWDELTQDEQNDIRTQEPQLHDVLISIRKERQEWAAPAFDRSKAIEIQDQLFASLSEAVQEELDTFGLTAGTVGRRFGPTDKPFYLNEARFIEYLSITKNRVQSRLDLLIGSAKYKRMDRQKQEDTLQAAISKAKTKAREELTKLINIGEI